MKLVKTIEINTKRKDARIKIIRLLRSRGATLQIIGNKFSITRERVRQLLLDQSSYEYVFRCDTCGNSVKRKKKEIPVCLVCASGLKSLRLSGDDLLKKVFSGKPKWKSEGRERTREIVRYRDNYTCQDCQKVWKKGMRSFDVHHLNGVCGKKSTGFDSIKDISSLITLCHKCHFNRPDHTLSTRKQKNRHSQKSYPLKSIEALQKEMYDELMSKKRAQEWIKINIRFTPSQYKKLVRESRKGKTSIAEVIRQLIDSK